MRRCISIGIGVLMLAALLTGCGTRPVGSGQSPIPSPGATPAVSPMPSPGVSPTLRVGAPAYVRVAVATLWRQPDAVRAVDAPALAVPVQVRDWLAAMSFDDQYGLIGRADSQVLLGDRVEVLALQDGWARVVVPDQATPLDARGYPGWLPSAQLTAAAPAVTPSQAIVTAATAMLAGTDGRPLMEVSFGTALPVVDRSASSVRVSLPEGAQALVDPAAVAVVATGAPARQPTGDSIVATALGFLGLRYLWAGTSGFGFDCSGLVYAVYRAHGILLPRDAADQAAVGTPVARTALLPGDLVFVASGGVVVHVGIYAGGGMVVESPDIGQPIREVPLTSPPFAGGYAGARRMLP